MVKFINDDHKEMHEVLLKSGFTFEDKLIFSEIGGYSSILCYTNISLDLSVFFDSNINFVASRFISSDICCPLDGLSFKEVTAYFTQKMLLDNAPKKVPIFLNSVKDVNESLTEYARTNTNFLKGTTMIDSVNGLSGEVQICLNPKTGKTISSNYGDSLKFINDDHREMHEVLLRNGFTLEQDSWECTNGWWDFIYRDNTCGLIICFNDEAFLNAIFDPYGSEMDDLHQKKFKEITAYFTQNTLLEKVPNEVPTPLNVLKDVNESLTEYARTNTYFIKGTKMETTKNITLTFGFNELTQAVSFIVFASKHNLACSTLQNNNEEYFVELPHSELPKLLGYLGGDSRERFAVETLVRVCRGNL